MQLYLRKGILLLLVCNFLLVVACSKINQQNYNKISLGMSTNEVNAILGKPNDSKSLTFGGITGSTSAWEDRNGRIEIQFFNDRAKIKTFIKGAVRPPKKEIEE